MTKPTINAARHLGDNAIRVTVKGSSWDSENGATLSVWVKISAADARKLAEDLVKLADEADSKIAKKAASEERRRKWREREIAAGRMRVMSAKDFFSRG